MDTSPALPRWNPPPADMPITNRLNLCLVAVVLSLAIFLLWLGSRLESWWAVAGVGVAFSYVLLTNYAILHEATHGNLHTSPCVNYFLGLLTGAFFPIPFTMIRTTHQGHHLRNRTDFEMFDLYYPADSRVVKYSQWYGILCGFFWPWIPLGAVLFALCPAVLRTRVWQRSRSSSMFVADIRGRVLHALRLELVFIVVLFIGLFWLLELRWQAVLILYACFSLNWSTRQYVGHAFTRRDVVEGAWNLKHNRLMTWVLLHSEYDLNHHRRPEVPWFYLPRVTRADDTRPSYVANYWRQWLGPSIVTEPAPESLRDIPLSVHQ